ncbi:hypothetical protein GCM10008018_10850 [Paenibacillus marchantiophytorum]|uniref:Transposase IS200-like domain-containing protein n=1 Tax=Paenibacillus marchantiophytorum TaxID=1619310 RepID=A0ABQ2BQI3_9BACL|nr:hypothetical protein GCM10008018_10850 [Paenibacillus marchantiophytorum]
MLFVNARKYKFLRGFKGFSHYCGDPKKGFKLLACEGCHDLRWCPIGARDVSARRFHAEKRKSGARVLSEDVCLVNHRHVILTIDEGLRDMLLDWGVGL